MTEAAEPTRLRICVAETQAQRDAIYRLRYQVSVLELRKRVACDHERGMLYDTLDQGDRSTLLFAEVDGSPVAATRLTWGARGITPDIRDTFGTDLFADFPDETLAFASRLVVLPEWRGSPVLAQLLDAIYRLGRDAGVRISFCHCTPALVVLYEKLGYRRYRDNIIDLDVGYHVPMVLLSEDESHFRQVRSPFLRAARKYTNTDETASWFRTRFPDYLNLPSPQLQPEDVFFQTMTQAIHQAGASLFDGLDDAEIQRFLKESSVLQCRAGDLVIRRGDVGNELFVLLSGSVQVRREVQGKSLVLRTFGEGEIFGELAFLGNRPRTADVVALTDLQVLVLSQRFFLRVMKLMPDQTQRILFNLSLVLCERLEVSTNNFVSNIAGDQGESDHAETV